MQLRLTGERLHPIGWDEVSGNTFPGCPQTTILQISVCQTAMITGMSYWHLAQESIFWGWWEKMKSVGIQSEEIMLHGDAWPTDGALGMWTNLNLNASSYSSTVAHSSWDAGSEGRCSSGLTMSEVTSKKRGTQKNQFHGAVRQWGSPEKMSCSQMEGCTSSSAPLPGRRCLSGLLQRRKPSHIHVAWQEGLEQGEHHVPK
jgi:hypothetical protein